VCRPRPGGLAAAVAAAGAAGTAILTALRPVRKSRISQPCSRAWRRSAGSGFTATACPTAESIGMSLAESL